VRSFLAGLVFTLFLPVVLPVSIASAQSSDDPPDGAAVADPLEQPDEPLQVQRRWLVPGPPPPPKQPGWFHLDRLAGFIELEASFEQQRRRRKTAQRNLFGLGHSELRQRNVDWRFREKFGLSVAGDVGGPQIFAFEGDIAFGMDHSHFREEVNGFTEIDSDNGFLAEFDVRARILQGGALNGEVWARRADDRISRRFIPSIREERTLYGAAVSLRSDIIPMRFSLEREHVDRDGESDPYDQEETTETRFLYEADVLFTDFHTLHVQYEFNDLTEEIAGGDFHFRTRRHEWLLEDRIEFGDRRQHRLDTTLRMQEEKGSLARDLFEFSPRLQLTHSKSLTSYASYQYLKERYEENGFESHRGEYTLVHQFYESLTTTANVFGQYEKFDDQLRAYTYGASLRTAYRKENRFGVFRAELGYEWDQRKERGGRGEEIQTRESGTFRDPRPIYLTEPFAVLSTVIVSNPQRTRFYLPGRDYLVTRFRNQVALHRISSGEIADGDSVWISYKFRRPTRARTQTQRFDARIEQQFDFGLRPYYEFNLRHQNIADPYAEVLFAYGLEEDDLTRHRVGVDYTRPRWSLGLEFESEDNRYDPFDAVHLNGQLVVLQTPRMNGTLSAMYSRFYFDSPDNRDVDLLDITFDGQFDFNDRLSAQLATAYRWENDSIDGVTHGVDLEATVVYQLGATKFELTGEYDLLEISGSPDDGMGVWLRVRRDLGDWIR